VARQYKRAYELTIIPANGEAKIITDLRINFEITKSILSIPNLCKFIIYNANEDTLSKLQKKFTKIVINAGYEGNQRLLFKGDVRNVFQSRNGVDKLTAVFCGDGEKDFQNSTFNKTFSENVSLKEVINEVLKTFKETTIGLIEGITDNADKLRGQTLTGSSKDILDNLADEYKFDWNIQDGEVIINPIDSILLPDDAVLVNSATGMINSPTITEIGVDVTTLLNPALLPNKAFKIESVGSNVQLGDLFVSTVKRTIAEGTYKIQEVVFAGDSRRGDWVSKIKGKLINV